MNNNSRNVYWLISKIVIKIIFCSSKDHYFLFSFVHLLSYIQCNRYSVKDLQHLLSLWFSGCHCPLPLDLSSSLPTLQKAMDNPEIDTHVLNLLVLSRKKRSTARFALDSWIQKFMSLCSVWSYGESQVPWSNEVEVDG